MKLIVGLGNPGFQYEKTRHNVGFMVVTKLADRHHLQWKRELRFGCSYAKKVGPDGFYLMKPQEFMNLSGWALQRFVNFHKIVLKDLLVVVDDVDLRLGRILIRERGSAGTHKGLKSVVEQLGSGAFPRLRVGIDRGDPRRDLADYVLSPFEPHESLELERSIEKAVDAAEMFCTDGIVKAMNWYNGDRSSPEND